MTSWDGQVMLCAIDLTRRCMTGLPGWMPSGLRTNQRLGVDAPRYTFTWIRHARIGMRSPRTLALALSRVAWLAEDIPPCKRSSFIGWHYCLEVFL
jgi:hypothetical protein